MIARFANHLFSLRVATAILALVGFLGIFSLWSAGMHMMDDQHGCILAQLQDTNCAALTGFEVMTFHWNAFNKFVQGAGWTPLSQLNTILLVVLWLAAATVAALTFFWRRIRSGLVAITAPPPVTEQRLQWLSLFEHSPSLMIGRG